MPDAVASLRNAENSAIAAKEPSYYTGSGRNSSNNSNDDKNKSKFNKKGLGALLTILLIFGGMGVFLGSSNSLLAPALSALLTSSTQTSYTSYVLRTRYITQNMMKGTGADAVNTTWTGKVKYSKIPNYMKNRLAKYDIEVIGSGSNTKLRWNNQDIDADQFVTMFNENVEFRDAYNKAKRGRVANFFDQSAEKLFKKLGLSRNWQANYKTTGDAEVDADNYNKTLGSKFEGSKTTLDANTNGLKERQVWDEENQKWVTETYEANEPINKPSSTTGADGVDVDAANSNAKSFISTAASKVASFAASASSIACSLAKIGSMIAITVAANEIYQSISYFMGNMESVSKMMAGHGDESGINTYLNQMSAGAVSAVTDYTALQVDVKSASNPTGDNPPQQIESGAPLESPALQNMMSNAPINPKSMENYSLERAIRKLGGAATFGITATGICAGVDVFTSVISISSIFAGGIPAFLGNFFVKTFTTFTVQAAATTFLGFLIPTVARALFTNVYDTAQGILAGNLQAQGAASSAGKEAQQSGLTGGDANTVESFNHNTNTVLALEAEQDRLNHSPFDITNRNTFFGSIAYSLLPTLTSTKTTGLASFLRSTSKSLSTLINQGVRAEGEGSSYQTIYGECPLLEEIGIKGGMFCNPIMASDMSTIELSPDDVKYSEVISESMKSCDEEGNCEIRDDSDLAHYITFCANRDSPFGVVDQNILGAFITNNTLLNSLPLFGDLMNIINAGETLNEDHLKWATGQICMSTADNSEFWNSKGKYYQRYMEDQRILTQMGAYEDSQNPVLGVQERYEENYQKTHPEANTYIGYLSRISGLTPENTETVLAFATYYTFVDQYDPTNRIAMRGDTSTYKNGEEIAATLTQNLIKFDSQEYVKDPIETNSTERKYIAYYDIRNRSYAA